ncbi:cd7 antigen-like isoform X2 [Gouania willdenowi]|uniref:cd7 antigen-like isoform X2 n=1 Tax=Gouania willdenowi TaxID=441366 RepID=UPI0010555F41|nr:uncharacterized protein LOC114471373 isoform X2 [Gouania willdenowi]
MPGIRCPACLWILFLTLSGFVCSDTVYIERNEGDSVTLSCEAEPKSRAPIGVYLKRGWLRPGEVLFQYSGSDFTVANSADRNRTTVSGDPSQHRFNITMSRLRPGDTDRYHCDFIVSNPSSEDESVRGKTDYFLLVSAGWAEVELVETCAGGSAVVPCVPPHRAGPAVEGVSLKRQRGGAPVEVLYHTLQPSSPPTEFPVEQLHLSSAPGPGGLTYSLSLQQLQPQDSALYSCQLLLPGRPDGGGLGRRVFFVSVQGDQCGCSTYSSLLYVLSSAVAVLLLLILIGFVLLYKGKARRSVQPHPHAPIYEEMVGVQQPRKKLASCHLDEMQNSEYRNCSVKKSCPENPYETPRGRNIN